MPHPKSCVWDHYDKSEDGTLKCQKCAGTLTRHLKYIHPEIAMLVDTKNHELQRRIVTKRKRHITGDTIQDQELRFALAASKPGLSIHLFDDEQFQDWIQSLQPRFKVSYLFEN